MLGDFSKFTISYVKHVVIVQNIIFIVFLRHVKRGHIMQVCDCVVRCDVGFKELGNVDAKAEQDNRNNILEKPLLARFGTIDSLKKKAEELEIKHGQVKSTTIQPYP